MSCMLWSIDGNLHHVVFALVSPLLQLFNAYTHSLSISINQWLLYVVDLSPDPLF